MIVVTGSMRSGTSLWMQILAQAGFPVIGDAFPAHWDATLRARNPRGFYESQLVEGVYHATNPHPESGAFLHPVATRMHAVKVFVPGLLRSDWAFLHRVIGTIRPWRVVAHSRAAMPHGMRATVDVSPALTWWLENYALVRDILVRGYPAHVVSYERLLQDPDREVREALAWVTQGTDIAINAEAAVAAVDPALSRSMPDENVAHDLDPRHVAVMDALYDHIHFGRAMTPAFVTELNTVDAELRPVAEAAREAVVADMVSRIAALSPTALSPSVQSPTVQSPTATPGSP